MLTEMAGIFQTIGADSMPTRAVKALRQGRITVDGLAEWQRNGTGEPGSWAGWLPVWMQTLTEWQAGRLFVAQRMGWEQWRTELYSQADRWRDRCTYESKVWTPAFCSGEDHSEAFRGIHAFYCLRVDTRFHQCHPAILDKLDDKQLSRVKSDFYAAQSHYGWDCWGSVRPRNEA